MGFPGRRKRLLYAYMQLLESELKPHTASRPQRLGLFDLGQANEVPVEATGVRLATERGRQLDVVEADHGHAGLLVTWADSHASNVPRGAAR